MSSGNHPNAHRQQEAVVNLLDTSKSKKMSNSNTITGLSKKKIDFQDVGQLNETVARLQTTVNALSGIASVLVIAMLSLVIAFAVLHTNLKKELETHSHAPTMGQKVSALLETKELCFKCENLRLGPSLEEAEMLHIFRKRPHESGEECCVDTSQQLLKLFEMHVEKKFWQEVARSNVKLAPALDSSGHPAKVAILLMGPRVKLDRIRKPGSQFPITEWTSERDLAFRVNVGYRHGRIVIPMTGLYYVFSQVQFFEMSYPDVGRIGGQSYSLSHYLYRYNEEYKLGGEEELIQKSITKCWDKEKTFGEYSSYIGAVFHLRQGDEISVKVSNLSLVSRNPKANYFGLFKL